MKASLQAIASHRLVAPRGNLQSAAGILAGLMVAFSASAQILDLNLIQNPGAEGSLGSNTELIARPPAGWTVTSSFTTLQYGVPGGYPDASTPGSPTRGLNFFAGGQDGFTTASQWIDVSAGAVSIDTGRVQYSLEGWLGGFGNDPDNMTVFARFLDAGNQQLAITSIGPTFGADRGNNVAFVLRQTSGLVPANTRNIEVLMEATRLRGQDNDSYADDLSLVLTTTAVPEPSTYAAFAGAGLLAFGLCRRLRC